jgi:N-acetylmuramoyl-L-alanine amidase
MRRHCIPCVGLVVLVGCFTFIVVPDEEHQLPLPPIAARNVLPTVVIDPGHGGNDGGATKNGLVEKEVALDVALRLDKALKACNFPTILTRQGDEYVSLPDRVAIANRLEHSLFVSIHFNQSSLSAVGGVETFYADQKMPQDQDWTFIGFFTKPPPQTLDNGSTLAGFIQAALVMKMDPTNRGIKARCLYVVRHTRAPAALIEGGFLSNQLEAQLLKNSDYRDRIAAAIAEGILSYQRTRPREAAPALADAQFLETRKN